ncbi:response regulator [Pantanalinema sp. GBBB05]|uniref:response regulator n=1 Tax=Pantanalinema sp. GBBB05 TaxID=2604139 RepID=UPI001D90138C|nr:response regulator [Pantanalinema sp. GBBB05]
MKILLVEDDDGLVKLLTKCFADQHYIVDAVKDGETGWSYASTFEYDLIVLDVVLPKGDGINLCQRLRTAGHTTPILLLTAQDTSTTKVQGLDAGADDYVVKPFDLAELIARIRALLRRGRAQPFPLLQWGDLCLNPSTSQITYADRPLTLTTKEYELLELLLRESQQVLSAEEILDRLWSAAEFPSEATVRSHIRRIRRKLVVAGAPPDLIATIHGRGYYLKAPAADAADPVSLAQQVECNSYTPPADAQQQYLAFLNQTWLTTRLSSLQRVTELQQLLQALHFEQLTAEQHQQAKQIAHNLAGTLGVFGLTRAVELSRQLEDHLSRHPALPQQDAPGLAALAAAVQHQIEQTITIPAAFLTGSPPLRILSVNLEAELAQSLISIAAASGMHLELATSKSLPAEPTEQRPDMILLRRISDGSVTTVMPRLAQRYPSVPMAVIYDRGDLSDRLTAVRQGSQLFLDAAMPPQQMLTCVKQFLHRAPRSAKVILVDDDPAWLSTLSTLLKPWKFEITTLAEPQQFWQVLQTVTPDVVVMDALMPQLTGFELCQIVRSDPYWQRLPILFLSALTDTHSQNHAFTVGADDYLCKPIAGVALAHRILQRLERVRTLALHSSLLLPY